MQLVMLSKKKINSRIFIISVWIKRFAVLQNAFPKEKVAQNPVSTE